MVFESVIIRALDFFFAAVGMLVLSPLLILISILGWFDNRSPFFQQNVWVKTKAIHIGEISNCGKIQRLSLHTLQMLQQLRPSVDFCAETSWMNYHSFGMFCVVI